MTKIRVRAFANRIEEFLADPACYEEKRFDSSLFTVEKKRSTRVSRYGAVTRVEKELHGICFGAHMELVMILLAHAYRGLSDKTTVAQYARAMAAAMQTFAEPIAVGDCAAFPDPCFLLHGINLTTLGAVTERLVHNGRIIHETLARRDALIRKYGARLLGEHGLRMLVEEGAAEDCLGLCCYITRADEANPHGTDKSYIAKVSFFLDHRNKEIYVITVQGQRVVAGDRGRSRAYARLAAALAMDPRAFVLRKVCQFGKAEGYLKVKVIRSAHHPLFLDNHVGFLARYEPIIRQAAIVEENGCYLQALL